MIFSSPAAPAPAWRSKPLPFQRILLESRWLFRPRPLPMRRGAQSRCFCKGFSLKALAFPSPAAPDPARRSKSLLLQRILLEKRWLFRPRPLPARPGCQNLCCFKGFSLQSAVMFGLGRSRPGLALKAFTVAKDFVRNPLAFSSPAAPDAPWRSKSLLFQRILIKKRWLFRPRPLLTQPGVRNRCFCKGFR